MAEHRHLDSIRPKWKEKSLRQHLLQNEAVDCHSEIVKDKKLAKM